MQELFGNDLVSTSTVKTFNFCSSVIAYNKGEGKFEVVALPGQVQFSSVNAIEFSDVNSDGRVDMLLGGNKFGFPPQFGRLDGSYGHVLINDGSGKMNWLPSLESGINIRGEIKSLRKIGINQKNAVVVGINNERPVIYIMKDEQKKRKT